MNIISLFEHQYLSFTDIGLTKEDQLWNTLDSLNDSTGQELVRIEHKGIRAREHVGVIQIGDVSIQILPKVDWNGDGNARYNSTPYNQASRSAIENLIFLLSYAYDLKVSELELTSLVSSMNSWFEILTRLFANDLHRQVMTGMSQNYVSIEETLPVLRGRWDIQNQVIHRPLQKHIFDVKYDEFSADISLNQVFKWVVNQLLALSLDRTNLIYLSDLQEWFAPVSSITQNPQAVAGKIFFSRLNERFEPAFNLARIFIGSGSIQLTVGGNRVFAFLVDMNQLFEKFLTRFLMVHQKEIFPTAYSSFNIIPQAEGSNHYLAERMPDGKNLFRLRPDLLFTRLGAMKPFLIGDIKYKLLSLDNPNMNISGNDLYQMLAYSINFDCSEIILFYPQTNHPILKSYKIQATSTMVTIQTVNLRQPLENQGKLIDDLKCVFDNLILFS